MMKLNKMIVDIRFNQLKKMAQKGATLLRYESEDTITFYLVAGAQVIYRSIMERPKDDMEYSLILSTLPTNLLVMNVVEEQKIPLQILELLSEVNLKLEELIKTKREDVNNKF